MSGAGTETAGPSYCGYCGRQVADGQSGRQVADDHAACRRRAALEPPRYCPSCARRLVVQVDPVGWRARCSRHGELHS